MLNDNTEGGVFEMGIQPIQADIIFKALHYVCRSENIEVPEECEEVFRVLAEENPKDTHDIHTIEVMEYLSSFIKNSEQYREYFQEEIEEEE
jgi:hypothetical protein